MINIKRLFAASTLILAGCASAPAKVASNEPLAAPLPTYQEKSQSVSLDQVKIACPADSKWEALEWKKVSPLANACVKAKDWIKVEKMGNYMATHAHLTPWGPYYLSLAAEGRKDYPRAIWMLELALKKAPKEGLFHYELGRIHWEMGDDSEAIKSLKAASDLNPGLTEAHYIMGQLAMQRHDLEAADTLFQKALQSNSKHLGSLLGMADLKIRSKDFVKAESFLNQVVSLNPRSFKARMALAQVQEEHLKKFQEALTNYKEIKHLNAEKKLDQTVMINLDDKIHSLEKTLSQAEKTKELSIRTPSGEKGLQ
jgi:tetratricopeptide (TPR) repeat protein